MKHLRKIPFLLALMLVWGVTAISQPAPAEDENIPKPTEKSTLLEIIARFL